MNHQNLAQVIDAFPKQWTGIPSLNTEKIKVALRTAGYTWTDQEGLIELVMGLEGQAYTRRGALVRRVRHAANTDNGPP